MVECDETVDKRTGRFGELSAELSLLLGRRCTRGVRRDLLEGRIAKTRISVQYTLERLLKRHAWDADVSDLGQEVLGNDAIPGLLNWPDVRLKAREHEVLKATQATAGTL